MTYLQDAIIHARQEEPKESCGLVIQVNKYEKYIPCKNISSTPEQNFIIDPTDYAKAEDQGNILKIVHSHPRISPKPSQADLVEIEKHGVPWLIVNPKTEEYTLTKPSNYAPPLLGREFSHGILDCYSIIRDHYSLELGIELLEFPREDFWWKKGKDYYRDRYKKTGFSLISEGTPPIKNDVIVMCLGSSTPNHAGVYLGQGKIIHHVQDKLSCIDVYGGYWRKITWGILRHKEFL